MLRDQTKIDNRQRNYNKKRIKGQNIMDGKIHLQSENITENMRRKKHVGTDTRHVRLKLGGT